MNIGTLSESNREFLKHYKSIGFKTMTDVVDKALHLLRKEKEKELRHNILLQAGKSYRVDSVWEKIDGEDFHE